MIAFLVGACFGLGECQLLEPQRDPRIARCVLANRRRKGGEPRNARIAFGARLVGIEYVGYCIKRTSLRFGFERIERIAVRQYGVDTWIKLLPSAARH